MTLRRANMTLRRANMTLREANITLRGGNITLNRANITVRGALIGVGGQVSTAFVSRWRGTTGEIMPTAHAGGTDFRAATAKMERLKPSLLRVSEL